MLALTSTSIFGSGVRGEALERGRPLFRDVARIDPRRAQQLRQRLGHGAVVAHGASRAGAALHRQAVGQPRGRGEVRALPVRRARRAVVGLARHVVLRAPRRRRRRDGDKRRHARRRPAGCRAAEWRWSRCRNPRPSSARCRSRRSCPTSAGCSRLRPTAAAASSCCTDDAELPVVRPHAPAAQDGRVDGGGVRVGVAEIQVVAAERRAQIAAGGEVVLLRRIEQVAIDDVVAVAVGPAAGRAAGARADARDDARRRIVGAVDDVGRRRFEVLADVDLERRLAVAEQVVGEPDARRDVVVAADADRAVERDRLRVEARRAASCRCPPRAPSSTRDRTGRRPAASCARPSIGPARTGRTSPCDRADPSAATGSTRR